MIHLSDITIAFLIGGPTCVYLGWAMGDCKKDAYRHAAPMLVHSTCEHHDLTPDSMKSGAQLLGDILAPMVMGVLNALLPTK